MKKLLSLFVATLIASLYLQISASDNSINEIHFCDSSEGWFVGDYYGEDFPNLYTGDVELPEMYNGLDIVGVRPYAFYKCDDLRSVTMNCYGFKKVMENAFVDCPNLEMIRISPIGVSEVVLSVGFFKNCPKLKTIIIEGVRVSLNTDSYETNTADFKTLIISQKVLFYLDGEYDTTNTFLYEVESAGLLNPNIPPLLSDAFSYEKVTDDDVEIKILSKEGKLLISEFGYNNSQWFATESDTHTITGKVTSWMSSDPEGIESISLNNAGVTGFNGEKLTGLKTLDLSGNNLTFASEVVVPGGCEIIADNQATISIKADGVTVDLSNYADSANIVWKKDNDEINDFQEESGVFTFTKNFEGIHAELTDKKREWLTLCTSTVSIDAVEEKVATFVYELTVPGSLRVTVSVPTIVNGEKVSESGNIVLPVGREFMLTANHPENISGLEIKDVGLTDIEIINLPELKALDVSDNSLGFEILDKLLPADCELIADNQRKIVISAVKNTVDLSDYVDGFSIKWLTSDGEEITAYEVVGGKYSFTMNYANIHAEISKGGLTIETTEISIDSVESAVTTLTYELAEPKSIIIKTSAPTLVCGKEIEGEETIELLAGTSFTLTANHPENIVGLNLSGIGLTAVDIEDLPSLKTLDLSENALTFEMMPDVPEGCNVTYGTQKSVEIEANGAVVDLSKYADATVVWKQGTTIITSYEETDGVYSFTENLEGIHAEMTKGGMTLTTTEVSINTLETTAATLTYELAEPKSIIIKTSVPTLVCGKEIEGEGTIELPAGTSFILTANHPENIVGLVFS